MPLMTFLDTGLYRKEATLVPFAVLAARRLPRPLLLACVAGAAVATLGVSPHFFDFTLV